MNMLAGLVGAVMLVAAGPAVAAELKVFSTIGVEAALEALTPGLEQASGDRMSVTYATAALLVRRIEAGETADAQILSREALEQLVREGHATTEPGAVFASSGMAMAVRHGAPRPDISTVAALRQTLLAARSVACPNPANGGAGGVYFAGLLERMGIAEQVKAKTVFPPPSGNAGVIVARGEAELAVQQTPELMAAAGVDVLGELPPGANNVTTYAAGVGVGSAHAEAVRRLIAALHSPRAAAVFTVRGLTPIKE